MKKILVIEPYYGGSHKQFLTGLSKTIKAHFTFLTLPARKWKMRMQLSAPWFAARVREMEDKAFDAVLCSTFVDVAVLRALLSQVDGWRADCMICTYFHENQFVYPNQIKNSSNHQFTAINFTTALSSDRLAFNSIFNLQSFLKNCREYLKKASDMSLNGTIEEINQKSKVIYPGLDFTDIKPIKKERIKTKSKPVLCWNHRWEHDKNPEEFFNTLFKLHDSKVDFELIIMGQSFRNSPEIFETARKRLNSVIRHFGYVESRHEYIQLLGQADIVVSTSHHEFFGIAVVEAVRAGCYPVVPNRLAYPELYPVEYLYKKGELLEKLMDVIKKYYREGLSVNNVDVDNFAWTSLADSYTRWLLGN